MPVTAGIHLHSTVSTRLYIGQQDFTKFICAKFTERYAVAENLKGDIGHCLHGLPVILDDPQSGKLFVDQ